VVWPVPRIDDENEAFWTGGIDGYLEITRCAECGYYVHPPAPRCGRCYSDRVAPASVSGRGRVYTFTVNEHAWTPGLEVPYVIAVVELEEQAGLRVLTNIVGTSPADVSIDMPVHVEFVERGAAFVPVFRPA
jgi:uncharacterized OB-fold protein